MKKKLLPRCNAINIEGKRCLKHSHIIIQYHGDTELYEHFPNKGKPVRWVEVNLCIEHAFGVNYNFIE